LSDNFDKLLENKIQNTPEKKEPPQKRPKKRMSFGKRLLLTCVIVLCVAALLVCGAAVWGYRLSVNGVNLPNVYIDGVSVGGMTPEETADALREAQWDALEGESLAVSLPAGAGFRVDYLRSGAVMSRDEAVRLACAYGHEGDVFTNLRDYLMNCLSPVDVATKERTLDETYIRACMDEGRRALDDILRKDAWRLDEEGKRLIFVKGAGGVELDTEALYDAVCAALKAGEKEIHFDKLLRDIQMPNLAQIYDQVAVEPVNAYFDTGIRDIVPETVGRSFDTEAAVQLWQAANIGEQVVVPITEIQPEYTAEALNAILFRDLLGAQMTYYYGSTPERVNNIRLAASKLDGLVLLPDETFSYNDVVGQRTEAAGFQIAKAYSDGQEVDELGGGICQVSSTLYGAALYARLKILTRQNHYFKVGYLDYGLDATVSWRQPDFRFKNNREFPVKLAAYVNEGEQSLVVEIWGTDFDGISVKLYHTEEDVFDEELPWVLVGKRIHTYGDLYDADGNYLNTVSENTGVYYFHDEDIEWPDNYIRNRGEDQYLG
jgi:hypothetical protein